MLPITRNRLATPTFFEPVLEPWSDLRREIDRLFDTVLSGMRPTGFNGTAQWMPPMDVEERDDRIRLTFELPGVSPDDVNVAVDNGVLTISGEKKLRRSSAEEQGSTYFYERRYGRFERALTLPQSVDPDGITAHYEDGVLVLELPKREESRRRKIEIGRGTEAKRLESGEEVGRKAA